MFRLVPTYKNFWAPRSVLPILYYQWAIHRSVSLLTVWGPPQIIFFAYYVGPPDQVFFAYYRGPPQISFFAYYMEPPSGQFLRLLCGSPQISFSVYYMGPPQVSFSLYYIGAQARVQEFVRGGGAQNLKALFFAFQFFRGGGPSPENS